MQPIDHFFRAARRTPASVALEWPEGVLSYRALEEEVRAFACALQAADPVPGSRVGICCGNDAAHVIAMLATFAAGKTWVPLYPRNSPEELARIVEFTEASIVVATTETLPIFKGAAARLIVADRKARRADNMAGLIDAHAGKTPVRHIRALEDTHAIKFTGGSTGLPKGVMQPLRAWNANIVSQILTWQLGPGDGFLAAAPLTHGAGTYVLPILGSGGRIVLEDQPRPERTLELLAWGRVTHSFLPPTVIYMMMEQGGTQPADFVALRALIYGGGPMRPDAIRDAQAMFGPVLASSYGQTEAPQIVTAITPHELLLPDRLASVGRETILTQVEILDPAGAPLPEGEVGEVAIRGDLVMTGYWRQPEKTAETIVNGWLRTGDLGAFDTDRFLTLKGRSRDLIITGGFNVYPEDVERVIAAHPAVADCAVFGIPDDKWGEAVHAAVVLHPGAQADAEAIVAHAKVRLGSVKSPKAVRFLRSLPRNAYGKLQRQSLIDGNSA